MMMIYVTTRAYLLDVEVAKISASLQILPMSLGSQRFTITEGESGDVVGKGICGVDSCTFTVTVANGQLTLTETWIPNVVQDLYFQVVNGSQIYQGKPATYGPIDFIYQQ